MFLARAARRSISNLFAASTIAPARAPSALRRRGSNPSNRTVHWTNTVEVKEIDLVKCEQCAKGHYHCKCIRRKYRYNGRMNVTFVTFDSQIPSEAIPPSIVDRVVDYFTAEAPPANADAVANVPADDSVRSSSNSSVHRSKRSRYSRRATNEVEQIGNEAEEPAVEFDAVAEPFVEEVEQIGNEAEEPAVEFDAVAEPFVEDYVEHVAAEDAVIVPKIARMLKDLENTLDGVYWNASTADRRTHCKPDRFSPDY